jgi:hypothetical protein
VNEIKAADLPDGSVVADNKQAFFKNHPSANSPWRGTSGGHFGDWKVDDALADGAVVLRHGYGSEGER